MRQWLMSVAAKFKKAAMSRRATRTQRRIRPALEAFEDRLLPTVAFIPEFGTQILNRPAGGAANYTVLNSPNVDLIFWGTYWADKTGPGPMQAKILTADAEAILKSPYLSGLKQYGSDGQAFFNTSWIDSGSNPTWPTYTDSHGAVKTSNAGDPNSATLIQAEIAKAIKSSPILGPPASGPGGAPASITSSPIYVVITDPTHAGSNGGYNLNGVYGSLPINMISIGTSAKGMGTAFGLAFSHEMVERMSDPTSDMAGVTVYPPKGIPAKLNDGLSQIGDNEPEQAGGYHYAYSLSGVTVQPYWSAVDDAYIVPDGHALKTYLCPTWTGATYSGSTTMPSIHISNIVGDVSGNIFALNSATGAVYEHLQGGGWSWTQVGGGVSSLVSDASGSVFAMKTGTGVVFEHVLGSGWSWNQVGGGVSSLVSDETGNIFAMKTGTGVVFEHVLGSGWSWNQVGSGVSRLISDASGNVLALNAGTGVVWEHVLGSGWSWNQVGSAVSSLVSDETGNVFAMKTGTGVVWEHVLGSGWNWNQVGSGVSSLVSDAGGNVFALKTGTGVVFEHVLGSGWAWNQVGGGVSSLVSDAGGNIFALKTGTRVVFEHVLGSGWAWKQVDSGASRLYGDVFGDVFVTDAGITYEHVLGTGWDWAQFSFPI